MAEKLFSPLANAFVIAGVDSLDSSLEPLPQQEVDGISSVFYKPSVLDCFPVEQKTWDVVQSMPMFCLADGVEINPSPKEPSFFANTLTMGNGDRHYSFCLKFFDEYLPEPEAKKNTLAKPQVFARDDIMHKSPGLQDTMPKDHWKENNSTGTTVNLYQFRNSSASDIRAPIMSPARPDIGHPLGELGTNLSEQLAFAKKRHTDGSDPSSDTSEDIHADIASIDAVQTQVVRTMRKIERRGSKVGFREELPKLFHEDLEPAQPFKKENFRTSARSFSLDTHDLHTCSDSSSVISFSSIDSTSDQVLYATKALIILSKFPYYQFFKDYLTQIYEFITLKPKGKIKMIPIEKYINNLLSEAIVPPPGNDLCLEIHGPQAPLYLWNPANHDLPLLDMSLEPLLLSLDVDNLIQVFIGLSLERKFLFTSRNSNLLYHCTHALMALLYPFEWQTGYVPVVPPSLLELTEALTPIILGITSNYIDDLEVPDDMIIVDLDNNEVKIEEHNELPNVPSDVYHALRRHLKRTIFPQIQNLGKLDLKIKQKTQEEKEREKQENQSQIRLCFVAFYVCLLRDIQKFVNVALEDTEDVFDIGFFLDTQITSYQEFWETMLQTRMFEIFTQKLANNEEAKSSMGLFLELSSLTMNCMNMNEIFDIVLAQPMPSIPELKISIYDPKASSLVSRSWNPLKFPELDPKLFKRPKISILHDIGQALRRKKSPQLHLLHAHALMQSYFYSRKLEDVNGALCACVIAVELDPNAVPRRYISSLLELFNDDDLQKILSNNATSSVAKEAREILENRKFSMPVFEPSELTEDESSSPRDEQRDFQLGEIPLDFDSCAPEKTIVESFKASLRQLEFPGKGAICSRHIINSLTSNRVIPDDSVTHTKLIFVLQCKKGMIPRKYLTRFLRSVEQVLSDCAVIQEKYSNVIEESEIALFSSTASSRSGVNGHLLITQERLLFVSKGKIIREHRLEDILMVEPHTYQLLIPGGMPCVQFCTTKREKPYLYSIWSSWSPTRLRDIWVRYIADMAAAWKMASDLKNPQIIITATQNLILSAALTKRHGNSAPPGCFQYFGECFPDRRWFAIPTLFQRRGMLNTDIECEVAQIDNQLDSVIQMLQLAIQLIHMFRNDGYGTDTQEYVDFVALKQSQEFAKLSFLICNLQRFSLEDLNGEEKTALFVNVYNILVLHAYIELEKFPANIWEWTYLERTAYYTIGGVAYSLWDIHHGILRHNRTVPDSKDIPFYSNDPRLIVSSEVVDDPFIIFTLSNHMKHSPSVFRLEPTSLRADLIQAANLFCQNTISFEKHRIQIPHLFKFYYCEFYEGDFCTEKLLGFIKERLTSFQRKRLDFIQTLDDFEIEWLQDWTPSAKVLVGAV